MMSDNVEKQTWPRCMDTVIGTCLMPVPCTRQVLSAASEFLMQLKCVDITTSTRAALTLTPWVFPVQEYKTAIPLYQDALAISPMYPDSWFKLGCAAMREEEWDISVQAFLRVVQQVRTSPRVSPLSFAKNMTNPSIPGNVLAFATYLCVTYMLFTTASPTHFALNPSISSVQYPRARRT
jgi:hypothetical protein